MEPWFEKVQKIAEQVAVGAGCELYDMEISGAGKGRVLQIFIDKTGGIIVEDCTAVSKGLNEFLDTEEIIPGDAYILEVSSPGLERKLKTEAHFLKVIGEKIAVQLSQNLGSLNVQEASLHTMKKFETTLVGFESSHAIFNLKNEVIRVPLKVIEKAKLVFEMNMMNKPLGKPSGSKQKQKR